MASITVFIQIICIHSTILYAWLSTQKFRSPIDFKELGLEHILIILWKASNQLSGDIIPVSGTDEEMFNKAQQAIINAKPFEYTFTYDNGNTETWYFKKWIEEFNGKKIKTDLSDPSRMCPLWYDEINGKENYMKQISD